MTGDRSKMQNPKALTKPKEWDYKPLLIIVALVYLAFLLFIPARAVFYYAFRNGFQAFLEAAGTSDFIEAVKINSNYCPNYCTFKHNFWTLCSLGNCSQSISVAKRY
jgi:ABC-type sugar transport system permease subunit